MRTTLVMLAICTAMALGLVGCSDDFSGRGGTDLFQLAVDEAPGGALLGVWVSPTENVAFLAGGLVGVASEDAPDGALGRLVRYENGAFVTVCRVPSVLWWVQGGLDGEVVASGEDGIVLRYRADGVCDVSHVDGDWPSGRPTLWGLFGTAADDVRFVGGSVAPDGPKGVLLHWDGTTYAREAVPVESATLNLFKIARASDRLYVVGDGATILERLSGEWQTVPPPYLGTDSTLFTVSCAASGSLCAAVGGRSGGAILLRRGLGSWIKNVQLSVVPGLNGVYVENEASMYIVGQFGETLHYNGTGFYEPPSPPTSNPLHAVAGNASLVIAVGGELGNPTVDQRATILVRGPFRAEYTLDGAIFRATGALRPNPGEGGGQ